MKKFDTRQIYLYVIEPMSGRPIIKKAGRTDTLRE